MPWQPTVEDPTLSRKTGHRRESYDQGLRAEKWAGWLMRAKGFDILHRRYKAKGGEIDLICQRQDCLVFLEVKYRDSIENALHAITPRNQQRIVTAASAYLAEHEDTSIETYRFDILVFAKSSGPVPRWQHLEAAFESF